MIVMKFARDFAATSRKLNCWLHMNPTAISLCNMLLKVKTLFGQIILLLTHLTCYIFHIYHKQIKIYNLWDEIS